MVREMARGDKTVKVPKQKVVVDKTHETPERIEEINETNIEEIEKKTMDMALKAISTLESSLAVWDGAKEKPKEMADRFEGYRRLHTALTKWVSGVLKARKGGAIPAFEDRLQKLREFTDICYSTSQG
ncbi:MAG: hypothetical protein V1861_00915 [Candidatus Micrarchaeota archaeon]